MEEADKLPLKRVELSLTKFNEVAIPHHLDLLRQHRANIIKYESEGEWRRVRSEQTRAGRVARQLRSLLAEVEALRRRVRQADVTSFDRLTQRSRDLTLAAIVDYLGVIERSCRNLVAAAAAQLAETSPLSINRRSVVEDNTAGAVAGSAVSTDSVGVVAHARAGQAGERDKSVERDESLERDEPLIQLQVDEHEATLREREAVLRGWSELQSEVHALHEAWQHVHAAAVHQREQVSESVSRVEVAADNVTVAREHLALSERLRAGAYGAGGAALGALVGGPVGLVVGAKAGACALVAGSLLGYLGARVLGRRRQHQIDAPADSEMETKQKDD